MNRRHLSIALTALVAVGVWSPPAPAQQVERSIRVYSLDSLWPRTDTSDLHLPPPSLRGTSIEPEWTGEDNRPITFGFDDEDREESVEFFERFEGAIRELIAEDSWSNRRNVLRSEGDRMLIVQTPDVLARIDALLRRWEHHVFRRCRVDVAIVPRQAFVAAVPDAAARAGLWHDAGTFDRAVAAAGADARSVSAVVPVGARSVLRPAASRVILNDHEVNQTGVIPVVNPIVSSAREGIGCELALYPAPMGDWFRIDATILAREFDDEASRRVDLTIGALDLPADRRRSISTMSIVRAGGVVVLGEIEIPVDSGALSAVVLLRAGRIVSDESAPGNTEEDAAVPRIVDLAALTAPYRALRLQAKLDYRPAYGDVEGEPLVDFDVLSRVLSGAQQSGVELAVVGRALLLGKSEEAERTVQWLEQLGGRRTRPITIELWQGDVPAAEVGRGVLLDAEEWSARMRSEGVTARLAGIEGQSMSAGAVQSRAYVSDLEWVSGGMPQRIVVASDPVVSRVGEGLLLNATASLVPGTVWAQLHVMGEFARAPRIERSARVRLDQRVRIDRSSDGPEVVATGKWLAIELPEEDTDRWEHTVTVPLGQPILLNVFPSENDGAVRALVAVVRVHALPERGPQ